MVSKVEEEEEEYVCEGSLSAALQEFTATYRDAETITGNVVCTCYNKRSTKSSWNPFVSVESAVDA